MKKYQGFIVVGISASLISFCCNKTVSTSAINPGGINLTQDSWTYFYWASCPADPEAGAPCFQYNANIPSDIVYFGTGTFFLKIGAHSISRSQEGPINDSPYSFGYFTYVDSVNYNLINDSTFVTLDSTNQVVDTVKIKAATNHLLVLSWINAHFDNPYELDSLKR